MSERTAPRSSKGARDAATVRARLAELRAAAVEQRNLMPVLVEAARAHVSEGEIVRVGPRVGRCVGHQGDNGSVIDEGTEFGARVARRLREEEVAWVTTVSASGAPLPRPIWFVWDGAESVLVYSRRGTRIRNIQANPRVTFSFDGNGHGGDIIVLTGRASVDREAPGAGRDEVYLAKYASHIERTGLSLDDFTARFPVPVRIRFFRLYGH